jgi:hypothetical protein
MVATPFYYEESFQLKRALKSHEFKKQRQGLSEVISTLLSRVGTWRRRVRIFGALTGTFAAGLGGAAASFLDPTYKPYGWSLQIFGLLLVFLSVVVLEFVDEPVPELLRRAHDAIDKGEEAGRVVDGLYSDFTWFTRLYSIAGALNDAVKAVIVDGPGKPEEQARRMEAMLDIVVADSGILFGIVEDRWNFAIYLYERKQSLLSCRACRRPTRAESDAIHRTWHAGEGHVGIAFQTQREIVASDTSFPESKALFDAPGTKQREDDRNRYRSIASIPIKSISGNVLGVVVGTSDVPGRFRLREAEDERAIDPVEPLRVLADHLAMLLDVTYIMSRSQGARK